MYGINEYVKEYSSTCICFSTCIGKYVKRVKREKKDHKDRVNREPHRDATSKEYDSCYSFGLCICLLPHCTLLAPCSCVQFLCFV